MVNICYLLQIIVIYRDVVQLFMVNICYLLQIIVIYRDVVQLFMVISVIYCKSLLFRDIVQLFMLNMLFTVHIAFLGECTVIDTKYQLITVNYFNYYRSIHNSSKGFFSSSHHKLLQKLSLS